MDGKKWSIILTFDGGAQGSRNTIVIGQTKFTLNHIADKS
jgi:hypothetical protein